MPGEVLRREARVAVLDRTTDFRLSGVGMAIAGGGVDGRRRDHRAVNLLDGGTTGLLNRWVVERPGGFTMEFNYGV